VPLVNHFNDEIASLVDLGLIGLDIDDFQSPRLNTGVAREGMLVDRQRSARRDIEVETITLTLLCGKVIGFPDAVSLVS